MTPSLAKEGKAHKGDEANEIIRQILPEMALMGVAQVQLTETAIQPSMGGEESQA